MPGRNGWGKHRDNFADLTFNRYYKPKAHSRKPLDASAVIEDLFTMAVVGGVKGWRFQIMKKISAGVIYELIRGNVNNTHAHETPI